MEEKKEHRKALAAIGAYRQLKGLGLMNPEEDTAISKRIQNKYGKYLSPIR